MPRFLTQTKITAVAALLAASLGFTAQAQTAPPTASDTALEFKPKGQLWGYAFGDLAYKGGSDGANRGGSNQYTNVPANTNLFQFRRIYLGYNYDLSRKFSAEFLLAAEDDFAAGSLGQSAGDVLGNNKFSPYIKLANIRWKNIYPGADLIVGQVSTPAFPVLSEVVWGYRSIERSVADIRRTPSFDMGATIQGRFIPKNDNFGYDVMVGNGQSAKPETDQFKWFYGDIYAKLFNKHLIIDLYQDYERLNWNPITNGQAGAVGDAAKGLHHDRNMTKIFVAYNAKKFTVGVEAFQNTLMGDVQEYVASQKKLYYATTIATAVSVYARGRIYKDKLGFFARYDTYDPTHRLNSITDNKLVTSYTSLTSQYNPTTKEQFVTFGLDFTPIKNVHFMPNVWMNTYKSGLNSSQYTLNTAGGTGSNGTDLVYRLTFYYTYGK